MRVGLAELKIRKIRFLPPSSPDIFRYHAEGRAYKCQWLAGNAEPFRIAPLANLGQGGIGAFASETSTKMFFRKNAKCCDFLQFRKKGNGQVWTGETSEYSLERLLNREAVECE